MVTILTMSSSINEKTLTNTVKNISKIDGELHRFVVIDIYCKKIKKPLRRVSKKLEDSLTQETADEMVLQFAYHKEFDL